MIEKLTKFNQYWYVKCHTLPLITGRRKGTKKQHIVNVNIIPDQVGSGIPVPHICTTAPFFLNWDTMPRESLRREQPEKLTSSSHWSSMRDEGKSPSSSLDERSIVLSSKASAILAGSPPSNKHFDMWSSWIKKKKLRVWNKGTRWRRVSYLQTRQIVPAFAWDFAPQPVPTKS